MLRLNILSRAGSGYTQRVVRVSDVGVVTMQDRTGRTGKSPALALGSLFQLPGASAAAQTQTA